MRLCNSELIWNFKELEFQGFEIPKDWNFMGLEFRRIGILKKLEFQGIVILNLMILWEIPGL